MRSRYSLLPLSFLVVGALLLSTVAYGEVIDPTNNTVFFYDNYESLGTNVSHLSVPDTSGDFDPVGVVCGAPTATYETAGAKYVQVTDGGTPGAYEGSNYLRMVASGTMTEVMFFTKNATQGDHVSLAFMTYVDGTTANTVRLLLAGVGGEYIVIGNLNAGDVSYKTTSATYADTGVNFAQKTWQKWQIDYVVGEDDYSVSVSTPLTGGGWSVSSADNIPLAIQTGLDTMYLDKCAIYNSAGACYFDEYREVIPEPSTFTLLACGLIGLLAYAWRKRK